MSQPLGASFFAQKVLHSRKKRASMAAFIAKPEVSHELFIAPNSFLSCVN